MLTAFFVFSLKCSSFRLVCLARSFIVLKSTCGRYFIKTPKSRQATCPPHFLCHLLIRSLTFIVLSGFPGRMWEAHRRLSDNNPKYWEKAIHKRQAFLAHQTSDSSASLTSFDPVQEVGLLKTSGRACDQNYHPGRCARPLHPGLGLARRSLPGRDDNGWACGSPSLLQEWKRLPCSD